MWIAFSKLYLIKFTNVYGAVIQINIVSWVDTTLFSAAFVFLIQILAKYRCTIILSRNYLFLLIPVNTYVVLEHPFG